MEFHLFYGRSGFIGYLYEEEIVRVYDKNGLDRTIGGLFKAFASKGEYAWKYSFRAELDNGEYWVVERDDRDIEGKTFSVTHYRSRNDSDCEIRITKRQLRKLLENAYEKEAKK